MAKQTAPTATRGGMVRQGFRVQSAPEIEFDSRTAYDFVLIMCGDAGELSELLPEDRRLVEATRAHLPAALQPTGDDAHYGSAAFSSELVRLILARPDIKTARDLADAVNAMEDRALGECLLGELLEMPELSVLTRRALDGSTAAFSELCAILEQSKGIRPPCDALTDVAPIVRQAVATWLEPFETVEARVGRMDDRDLANRRAAFAGADPFEFVEQVTNGIRMMPDSRIRRIVLAPSYFSRPYNSVTMIGDTQLINYPIADEALDAADTLAPPQSVVRLHRALGDESRLRILRLLSERDRYLTELATELELSKPTTKHHLAILRAAGLVTLIEQAGLTYYSLRRERLAEGGAELRTFLRA